MLSTSLRRVSFRGRKLFELSPSHEIRSPSSTPKLAITQSNPSHSCNMRISWFYAKCNVVKGCALLFARSTPQHLSFNPPMERPTRLPQYCLHSRQDPSSSSHYSQTSCSSSYSEMHNWSYFSICSFLSMRSQVHSMWRISLTAWTP
jgi:hypothetical protein